MKRTPPKRKSKSDIRKLQDKLWKITREIVLVRDERNGKHYCYTCGREVDGSNRQVGHFIPKAACPAELKYDLDNLRVQCYHCNINLGGYQSEFYRRLEKDCGKPYVNRLFKAKNSLVKADKLWYEKKIAEYEKINEDNSIHSK